MATQTIAVRPSRSNPTQAKPSTSPALQNPKCATSWRQVPVFIHESADLFRKLDALDKAIYNLETGSRSGALIDSVINASSDLAWALKGEEEFHGA